MFPIAHATSENKLKTRCNFLNEWIVNWLASHLTLFLTIRCFHMIVLYIYMNMYMHIIFHKKMKWYCFRNNPKDNITTRFFKSKNVASEV